MAILAASLRPGAIPAPTGVYWLQQPGMLAPYKAYCDMDSDGGGWTAIFAGQNGSSHVFDHFDSGAFVTLCPDPKSNCLRRAPLTLDPIETEIALSCGSTMVKFSIADGRGRLYQWITAGNQSGWVQLPAVTSIGKTAAQTLPSDLFTGSAEARSFVIGRLNMPGRSTFASSSELGSPGYDYCNGTFDQSSLVRIFYRSRGP
jgi:hypothetical protein